MRYLLEHILDEILEFALIFDDDWAHRPLELVPDFLDRVEMW